MFITMESGKSIMNLFEYQKKSVEFGVCRDRCLLALDPGLGKTIVVLKILEDRKLMVGSGKILVIVPASLRVNFRSEVKKWGYDESVFIIESYEWLVKKIKSGIAWVRDIKAMIVDEVQDHIRNKFSKRTIAIWEVSKWVKIIYFLSGTPVKKSSTDLYSVLRICEGVDKWGVYSAFESKYAVKKWNPWKRGFEYTGFKNSVELKERIKSCVVRYKKKDVLEDLPELIEGKFIIENGCGEVESWSPEELLSTNKEVKDHISMVRQLTALKKISPYIESLSNRGISRGLVFVWHKNIGEKLAEELECPFVSGDIVADKRLDMINSFENGLVDWLVCTISSCGVGFNISSANYVGFFEMPFTYSEVEQSYSRAWRHGNRGCSVEYVLMDDSIDEAIYYICMNRKNEVRRLVG